MSEIGVAEIYCRGSGQLWEALTRPAADYGLAGMVRQQLLLLVITLSVATPMVPSRQLTKLLQQCLKFDVEGLCAQSTTTAERSCLQDEPSICMKCRASATKVCQCATKSKDLPASSVSLSE